MSKTKTDKSSRIIAEETTTMAEGAVISVYRISVGKVGHEITKLVALHPNMKRVEMTVDNISPQNLRLYLPMCVIQIRRIRAGLKKKPALPYRSPKTFDEFVNDMAFHDMFIFEALTEGLELNADKPKPVKKVVSRRRKIQEPPQVLPGGNGTVQGSGAAATDS